MFIPCTTAHRPLQSFPDLLFRWFRVVGQKVGHGHDLAGRTEPALDGVLLPKCLLQGIEPAIFLADPFNGHDLTSLGLHRQHRAALDGQTIEQDHAAAALAGIAAHLGPREAPLERKETVKSTGEPIRQLSSILDG